MMKVESIKPVRSNTEVSKGRIWTARILSGLVILFMLVDGIGKLLKLDPVIETTVSLGFKEHHVVPLGVIGLIATLLFALPRTAVLGALLLTAYWGGAIAVQVRMDAPLFSNELFPVYLGILCWAAVWLRDERVRRLFF